MVREGLHYLAGNKTAKRTASRNRFTRKLAARFVAGESLAEALGAIHNTNQQGMKATLDELGENVESEDDASAAANEYTRMLAAITANSLDANVSCKLTHLGLDLGHDFAQGLLHQVLAAVAAEKNFLRVDMEGSKYTQTTIDMVRGAAAAFPGSVGTVIQTMLYRSAEDAQELSKLGIRVRLVKGAYLETSTVAYPEKSDVDENYRRITDILLSEGRYPAFATHDELLIENIKNRAVALGRKPSDFEFQMLYGVRRDLHRKLRDEGFTMRLYIPYGAEWYPYLVRRLAERPANLFFFLSSVTKEARA